MRQPCGEAALNDTIIFLGLCSETAKIVVLMQVLLLIHPRRSLSELLDVCGILCDDIIPRVR